MFYKLKNICSRSYELTSCCLVVKKQISYWQGVETAHLLSSKFFLFDGGMRKSEFILIKFTHLSIQVMKIIYFKHYSQN